jgi:pimeloyl-ACP methyl ester carboxylesterase
MKWKLERKWKRAAMISKNLKDHLHRLQPSAGATTQMPARAPSLGASAYFDHSLSSSPIFATVKMTASTSAESVLSSRHVDAMAIPGALTGGLNYYRAAFGQGLWPAPPVVDIPVKVIWGEQDFSMEKAIATPPPKLVRNATVVFVPQVS